MQNNYFTPIKTGPQYHRQLFNSDSLHREGDWVCLNCQNLNYSFRKMCNRCKTQSRSDNDKHSVYSYYYFNRHDTVGTIDLKEFDHLAPVDNTSQPSSRQEHHSVQEQANKENQPQQWHPVMQTPKKKKSLQSPVTSKLDGLPSVSPLVKKYRLKQHHTTLEKLKQHNTPNIFELSEHEKQFQSIKIRDFDQLIQDLNFTNGSKTDIDNSPFKENSDQDDLQGHKFMKDIEQSISRIII